MSRDDSHLPLTAAHERRMRDDAPGGSGGLLVGYNSGPDGARPIPGDEKFPFFISPPDLGELATYARRVNNVGSPLPHVTSGTGIDQLAQGVTIDVRGVRLLTFYLTHQYNIDEAAVANGLVFIPQVANSALTSEAYFTGNAYTTPTDASPNSGALLWHSISVVDPLIRGAFPTTLNPAQAFNAPNYGFRNVHMTELVVPLNPAAGSNIHTTLVFDVAPYEYFRLLWGTTTLATPPGVTYDFPPWPPIFFPTTRADIFALSFQAER